MATRISLLIAFALIFVTVEVELIFLTTKYEKFPNFNKKSHVRTAAKLDVREGALNYQLSAAQRCAHPLWRTNKDF
jgi:hypothetical protein